MYMYVNKRVELAGRGVGLQKMYALLFYYYQFRHLTLEDIQLFILLLALNKEKKTSWTAKTLGWCERKVHSINAKHDTFRPSPADTGPLCPSPADTGPFRPSPADTGPLCPSPADTGPLCPSPADTGPFCPSPEVVLPAPAQRHHPSQQHPRPDSDLLQTPTSTRRQRRLSDRHPEQVVQHESYSREI